jgi:aspartate racemase
VHLQLAESLTTELRMLGRREGATLFMVLLAAFQTLLHRYTGQDKIVVGSPVANRNRREIEELIGCFLNVLALHTDMSGNPSFRDLLGRVRQVALGAYAHQDVPFEKLVGELQLERELSHAPLFQAVFVLQNMPMGRLELTGLAIERLDVQRGSTQSDLYFSITETGQGLTGTLKYNSDLYDAHLIERMLRDYELILREVAARPELRLLDIPLRPEGRAGFELSAATARDTYVKDQFAF